jgi:hypothetical protein
MVPYVIVATFLIRNLKEYMTNNFRFTCSVGGTTWAVLRSELSKADRIGDSK